MKNKPASLLVVSLGEALNGMPSSSWGRQAVGSSSPLIMVAQTEDLQTEHELLRSLYTSRCIILSTTTQTTTTATITAPTPNSDFNLLCFLIETDRICEVMENL